MISILVPYRADDGPRDRLWTRVQNWWRTNFPDAELCVGTNDEEPFNRAAARNDAFSQSHGRVLIVADADTVPQARAVEKARIAVGTGIYPWSLPYGENRYYNLTEEFTEKVLAGEPLWEPEENDWEHKITSWAGCLVLSRDAWESVDGYDERFKGWGGEDNAFQLALDVIVGKHQRIDDYICHLWHPRGQDFGQPDWEHNRQLLSRYQRAKTQAKMREVLES